MSAAAGKQELLRILNQALKEDTRATLDVKVHIADLNKNTLIRANRLDFTSANAAGSEFTKSYKKFIAVINRIIPSIDTFRQQNSGLTDIELAASIVSDEKRRTANIWLDNEKLLISSGFNAMSAVRTKIYSDSELINDIYFGKSNRVRSIYEQLKDRGIELDIGTIPDEKALTDLLKSKSSKDALYLFPETGTKNAFGFSSSAAGGLKVYQLSSKKEGKKSIGILIKASERSFETVALIASDGTARFEDAKKYIGYRVATDFTGDISVYPNPNGKSDALLLDTRLLSVADVGHAYFTDRTTGRTPAGEKLKIPSKLVDAFTSTQLQRVNTEIAKLQRKLNRAHGAVDFAFYKNTIQDKVNSSKSGSVSIKDSVVVVFQDYKVNSKLSSVEKKIVLRFISILSKEILRIPGSNTLKQDLIQIYSNRVIKPLLELSGKSTEKLKPTANIAVKKDINIKSNIKQSKGSLQKIVSSGSNITIPRPQLKISSKANTSNLIKLQNLINQSLVERVKQNMGRGDRRDILNLRSGRFAESVKIERMSQSREGMITAFYSYMKNPYATFSTGGLQGSPKTRDPKLLISKSIRELATQQVQNRLRSVAV